MFFVLGIIFRHKAITLYFHSCALLVFLKWKLLVGRFSAFTLQSERERDEKRKPCSTADLLGHNYHEGEGTHTKQNKINIERKLIYMQNKDFFYIIYELFVRV